MNTSQQYFVFDSGYTCNETDYDPCNDSTNPNPCGEGQKCVVSWSTYYASIKYFSVEVTYSYITSMLDK